MLWGCYNTSGPYAPVSSLSTEVLSTDNPSSTYQVKSGDTLYSIAWAYGLDYRDLASINHLPADYTIHPGQELALKPSAASSPVNAKNQSNMPIGELVPGESAKKVQPVQRPAVVLTPRPDIPVSAWRWPARGSIAQGYSAGSLGNKGVDIAGVLGEPVWAAAPGVVVYSGAGVRGYGNLIIIKHNNSYLSAYAFNQRLLVHLGERVVAGQEIALMGRNNAGKTLLHFEIRRNGQPINPLPMLR